MATNFCFLVASVIAVKVTDTSTSADANLQRAKSAALALAEQIYDRGWVSLACFGKLWRARSRLYRSRILQVKMRLKALAEINTMHSFAPFSNLNLFVKNCWIFLLIFYKMLQILPTFYWIFTNFFGIFPKYSNFGEIQNCCIGNLHISDCTCKIRLHVHSLNVKVRLHVNWITM